METTVAHLGRVRGVHQQQGDARAHALVGQEQAQLIEGPAVGAPPFCLGPRLPSGPFADARQVFKGDRRPDSTAFVTMRLLMVWFTCA